MNLGIDFGTTNSSLAFQRSARHAPECARVDEHADLPYDTILRTAVLLDGAGRVIPDKVGAVALDPLQWVDRATGASRRRLTRIKPFLRTFRLREVWPVQQSRIDFDRYDYVRQEPGSVTFRELVESGEIECSRDELMEIGAEVFRRLRRSIPSGVLANDPRLVIGVPLTFPDYAKKRLLDIIVRSGIAGGAEPYREAMRRVRFLPEPVGASLLYAEECEPPRGRSTGRVLVFDAGGGTLDLALLEFDTIEGAYRPVRQLCLAATELAGRRFDERIEQFGLATYRDAVRRTHAGVGDPEALAKYYLEQAAEDIKVGLSTADEFQTVVLSGSGVMPRVTRRDFERWAAPLLDETEAFIRKTVGDLDAVDSVIMVGGSSLVPCVQDRVRDLFPSAQCIAEDPESRERGGGVERAMTAVSRGLALYDETIGRQGVTPFAYGFWDDAKQSVRVAAAKWTSHATPRPVVELNAPVDAASMTLTLVQEMVAQERVLNLQNVPTLRAPVTRPGVTPMSRRLRIRVLTSEGSLYPRIERLDEAGGVLDSFDLDCLPEPSLRRLVQEDDHALRWPTAASAEPPTPYFEIVPLRVGDEVSFLPQNAKYEQQGTITRIRLIRDGLSYREVVHWDLSRYVFTVLWVSGGCSNHHFTNAAHIRLARGSGKSRARQQQTAH